MTSDKNLVDWGDIFSDAVLAMAILDQLLHHSTTINIKGESYRLKSKRKGGVLNTPVNEEEAKAAGVATRMRIPSVPKMGHLNAPKNGTSLRAVDTPASCAVWDAGSLLPPRLRTSAAGPWGGRRFRTATAWAATPATRLRSDRASASSFITISSASREASLPAALPQAIADRRCCRNNSSNVWMTLGLLAIVRQTRRQGGAQLELLVARLEQNSSAVGTAVILVKFGDNNLLGNVLEQNTLFGGIV